MKPSRQKWTGYLPFDSAPRPSFVVRLRLSPQLGRIFFKKQTSSQLDAQFVIAICAVLCINKRTIIGWERDGRYPRSIEMLEKMADIFHVPLTYLQPDQSLFIERAAEAYGKKGKIEAQHLAFELTELFASGELTPQDMDGIMYEMHKAYFKYREQKREKERIMNL